MYKKLYDVVIVLTKGQICGQNPTTFTSKIVCIHKDDAFDQKEKSFFLPASVFFTVLKRAICVSQKRRENSKCVPDAIVLQIYTVSSLPLLQFSI